MRSAPPARLHAILARAAPVGVVLRRGPSRWVELVLWDRATDSFTRGAWFHGRIYERRCDLSPSGELFVYFAAKYGKPASAYTATWTAVSCLCRDRIHTTCFLEVVAEITRKIGAGGRRRGIGWVQELPRYPD